MQNILLMCFQTKSNWDSLMGHKQRRRKNTRRTHYINSWPPQPRCRHRFRTTADYVRNRDYFAAALTHITTVSIEHDGIDLLTNLTNTEFASLHSAMELLTVFPEVGARYLCCIGSISSVRGPGCLTASTCSQLRHYLSRCCHA